jgi:hypothetical protein
VRVNRLCWLAVVVLAVSGCSVPGDGADSPSAPTSTSAASSPAPDVGGGSPSAAPTGAPAGTATPPGPSSSGPADGLGSPVATRTSSRAGQEITLALYPVVRDGSTSHLNLTLTATKGDVGVADMLSDHDREAADADFFAADGLQLVEGKHAKLYLVASDGQGECVCSRDLASALMTRVPLLVSATFAAPPADVSTVAVRVPAFGVVKDVPVQ